MSELKNHLSEVKVSGLVSKPGYDMQSPPAAALHQPVMNRNPLQGAGLDLNKNQLPAVSCWYGYQSWLQEVGWQRLRRYTDALQQVYRTQPQGQCTQ